MKPLDTLENFKHFDHKREGFSFSISNLHWKGIATKRITQVGPSLGHFDFKQFRWL